MSFYLCELTPPQFDNDQYENMSQNKLLSSIDAVVLFIYNAIVSSSIPCKKMILLTKDKTVFNQKLLSKDK